MATPQIIHQYPISSFHPSGQMSNPAGEGPNALSQGSGQSGAGNSNCRQGPEPRYNRGHNKWNASAPAQPARNRRRGSRKHAYPPRNHNNPQNNHYNGPGQGHNNHTHHHNNNTNRNPSIPNGSYQPRGSGYQNHQDRNQHHHNNYYRYNQGVFGRKDPKPVVKRGLDYDNDSTMTGMPFMYTQKQWKRIQYMRRLRDQQRDQELQYELQRINLDSHMADAPAMAHAHPAYSDWDMLDVPDNF